MKLQLLTMIVAGCLLSGCQTNHETQADTLTVEAPAHHDAATVAQTLPASATHDLYSSGLTNILKTANCRFEVADLQKSIDAIELAIRKHDAFIASSELRAGNPFPETKMVIRVPSASFYDLLKEIDQQAIFTNFRDIKTEDVSKQFVDLESRLRTKREVEQRYTDILRRKAGTIDELLKAEKMIGELHEDIEATISRINYLKDEVRYSTINLGLYQKAEQLATGPDDSHNLADMRDALVSGWNGLLKVVIGLMYLWPLVVISVVTTVAIQVFRKRHQRITN